MDGPLCIFDGLDVLVHMLSNMDPKAPSGKQYNPHPYLVLNGLITEKSYHFWVAIIRLL